jgi:ribulose-5-phosphate 4-epimerase/fuculose-1-phosphate aldolase
MQLKVSPIAREECSAQEWQARVDLAAAHRIAVMHGFNEGIFNHLTLVVPGKSDRYYQIPLGMHWSEVKASSFMEVGIDDGKVKRGAGDVERSCFCIHAPIHKALSHAKAVFHTHMPFASALTRLEDQTIQAIGQTELGTLIHTGYDDHYDGPAFDPAEGARLAKLIGDKTVLMMANHGVLVASSSIGLAFDEMYYFERAAETLITAYSTGKKLRLVSDNIAKLTASQWVDYPGFADQHLDQIKAILDKEEPEYRS